MAVVYPAAKHSSNSVWADALLGNGEHMAFPFDIRAALFWDETTDTTYRAHQRTTKQYSKSYRGRRTVKPVSHDLHHQATQAYK